jgi:hypothetical protein
MFIYDTIFKDRWLFHYSCWLITVGLLFLVFWGYFTGLVGCMNAVGFCVCVWVTHFVGSAESVGLDVLQNRRAYGVLGL